MDTAIASSMVTCGDWIPAFEGMTRNVKMTNVFCRFKESLKFETGLQNLFFTTSNQALQYSELMLNRLLKFFSYRNINFNLEDNDFR